VKAERGTLDIVFANAGAGSPLPLGKITAEHIDETFDTNVKGTRCCWLTKTRRFRARWWHR
jgi:NAD(P)-dependent dehydrogenase (short-subunit alcohol dehydrogenase family)